MPVSEAETTTGSPTGASALAVVGEGVLRLRTGHCFGWKIYRKAWFSPSNRMGVPVTFSFSQSIEYVISAGFSISFCVCSGR